MSGRRLGVFGGTFDPPHVGHMAVAVNARHALDLDEVLLVVAGEPWQKVGEREISPAEDRLAMVEAAVGDVAGLEPCDVEVRRSGPSYTADTLAELHDAEPDAELFLVLGSDAAAGLDTWERGEEVQRLATVVVVDRPGEEGERPPPGWRYRRVECPRLEVSSTDLRARVLDGRPLDYLVPEPVISCIAARRLYRSGVGADGSPAGLDTSPPAAGTAAEPVGTDRC
jgi:nicotinate-nucleotide adenylyltransferase